MTVLFRFRFEELGGHTHVRLFAGKGQREVPGLPKCGDLVFRNEEWDEFKEIVKHSDVEIVPDERG